MKVKKVVRDYKISDGNLKQTVDNACNSMDRDAADFAKRKVTAADIAALRQEADDFGNLNTDEENEGLVRDAEDKRDALAENVRVAIRPIRNMAEIAFDGKGMYNTFGFEGMAQMDVPDLIKLGKRVVRMANKCLPDLTKQGLTPADLTNLTNQTNDLDKAVDEVEKQKENRELDAQLRIIKGNALFAKYSKYCKIGQSLYADTNPAKYNDYVITEKSAPNDKEVKEEKKA